MYLLLPMDGNDAEKSKLTKIDNAVFWAQILIEEGKLIDIKFNQNKDDFKAFSEAIVITNDHEYVWPFIELGMMVLVAHTQQYIDDIVEAFIFKELHDLAY